MEISAPQESDPKKKLRDAFWVTLSRVQCIDREGLGRGRTGTRHKTRHSQIDLMRLKTLSKTNLEALWQLTVFFIKSSITFLNTSQGHRRREFFFTCLHHSRSVNDVERMHA